MFGSHCVGSSSSSPTSSLWAAASPTDVVITPITVYPTAKDKTPEGLNIIARVGAGLTAGCLSVLVAQPTDVVKVRFQAEVKGAASKRYANTRQAYLLIYKHEGFNGLWKGTMANATRNSIVNVAEIVVYDTIKDFFLKGGYMKDNIYCHFTTASIAGLCATFVASPVDVIKTRYMNSPKGSYKGALDCAVKTFQKEGFLAFYKGFIPSFTRLVTWNIILWLTFEQIKRRVLLRLNKNKTN